MCSPSLTARLALSSIISAAAGTRAFASPAPGSREFIEAYQRALDSQQMPTGAARTKQGTVNAAIVGYYDSMMFFGSLAPSTQAIRRQNSRTLPHRSWRQAYRLLPKRFIVLTIGKPKVKCRD
jgi:hypothetical protein